MVRLILLRALENVFRHRWSYILTLAVSMIAAVIFFVLVPPNYRVRGTIYVQRESLLTTLASVTDTPNWINPAQETLSKASSLIATETFAVNVLRNTMLSEELDKGPRERERVLKDYRRAISISAEGDSIVVFTAQDLDPVLAQQLAVETMNAYVEWRTNFVRADSEVAQLFFADLVMRYEEELADAEQQLRDYLLLYPDPIRGDRSSEERFEINQLQNTVNEASARLLDAREKEENARLALTKSTSSALQEYLVIDAPSVPNSPPSLLTYAVLIFAGFTVLGMMIILMRIVLSILFDRSLYFPLDVEHSLKQPTLAMLPLQPNWSASAASSRQAAAQDPGAQTSAGQVSPIKS